MASCALFKLVALVSLIALVRGGGYFSLPEEIEEQVLDLKMIVSCNGQAYKDPLLTEVFNKGFMFFPDIPLSTFSTNRIYLVIKSLMKLRPVLRVRHHCGSANPDKCFYESTYDLKYDVDAVFSKPNAQYLKMDLTDSGRKSCLK